MTRALRVTGDMEPPRRSESGTRVAHSARGCRLGMSEARSWLCSVCLLRSNSVRRLSLDDEVDLDAGPKRQRSHPDRRAGGKRLAEMLCVDPIHCDEVGDVREIHPGARNVIETPAGRLENRCEIPKDTLCLGLDTSFDHLASGRVLADLTAEVEEATDFDCLGKRADRWREFGRDNCSLAHGTLTPVDTGLHP